ncbi:MAG: excalibur calcium-binding domain-containing protein [Methylovulum sp.]|nr:excalibur calcium-binding domain-containing protein [Methylovulum sp.]
MFLNKLLLLCIILVPINSYGGIYKCADGHGGVVYSNIVCDSPAERQLVNVPLKPETSLDRAFFSSLMEKMKGFIKGFGDDHALNSELPDSSAHTQSYHCDGRTRCPQMTSCDEANFFIKHCPNTEMDGDNDGTPCESQWCR